MTLARVHDSSYVSAAPHYAVSFLHKAGMSHQEEFSSGEDDGVNDNSSS